MRRENLDHRVMWMFFCSSFYKVVFFEQILEKFSDITFHENSWNLRLWMENNHHNINRITERKPYYQKGLEFTELILKCWVSFVVSLVLQISTNIDIADTPLNLAFTKEDSLM
jgi:hypothetical protein